MRQILSAIALFGLGTSGALAIDCLNGQSPDILSVESWELSDAPAEDGSKTISITLQPSSDRGIRLIDGTVKYEDVLGERVGEFILERAEGIPSGQSYVHEDVVAGTVLERFEQLHPDDIAAIVCVSALVYDDGTLMQFAN